VEAIEKFPRVEAKLTQWREELERKQEDRVVRSASPKAGAEREARVNALLARVAKGDVSAIAELKSLI
jgi:mRNA-degrading endonuclease HigB of HigAB toxin-antitoxin module